ncbi:MAG: PTS transporter subunit IIC [Bacillota bacterium]
MLKILKKVQQYLVKVLNGMALGLFSSLIIGLIISQLGELLNIDMLIRLGEIAQFLMGPAIGVGIAHSLNLKGLGLYSSLVTGALGAGTVVLANSSATIQIGEPVGALIAAVIGAEIAKRVTGKTPVDIVLVPATTIIAGGIASNIFGPWLISFSYWLGQTVNLATKLQPFPMGIAVSAIMGIFLTLPVSSAALAISLGLEGLAAGAATVGCSAQMIGFAVISFKDNGFGGLIAQGLGTSMLQIPNIIRKPLIWIPPIISSVILGPVATVIFEMENNRIGAGMGTSGLVGQVATLETMGSTAMIPVLLLHFILPAIISYLIYKFMFSYGLLESGDFKLSKEANQ